LLFSAFLAIVLANSPWKEVSHSIWEIPLEIEFADFQFIKPLHFYVNEGLMTLFSFFVGLELKREFRIVFFLFYEVQVYYLALHLMVC